MIHTGFDRASKFYYSGEGDDHQRITAYLWSQAASVAMSRILASPRYIKATVEQKIRSTQETYQNRKHLDPRDTSSAIDEADGVVLTSKSFVKPGRMPFDLSSNISTTKHPSLFDRSAGAPWLDLRNYNKKTWEYLVIRNYKINLQLVNSWELSDVCRQLIEFGSSRDGAPHFSLRGERRKITAKTKKQLSDDDDDEDDDDDDDGDALNNTADILLQELTQDDASNSVVHLNIDLRQEIDDNAAFANIEQDQPPPMINGLENGHGTKSWANGDNYVGDWRNGTTHGQGTYTWANDDQYVGAYKDDKQHGEGTMTWADGRKYVGTWKNGEENGQGIFTFANDDKYVGALKDGKMHGQGIYTWADGGQYVGAFKNGEKSDEAPDPPLMEVGSNDEHEFETALKMSTDFIGLLHLLFKEQDCITSDDEGKGVCGPEIQGFASLWLKGTRQIHWINNNGNYVETIRILNSICLAMEGALQWQYYIEHPQEKEVECETFDTWVSDWCFPESRPSTPRIRCIQLREMFLHLMNFRNALRSGSVVEVSLALPKLLCLAAATHSTHYVGMIKDFQIQLATCSDRILGMMHDALFLDFETLMVTNDQSMEQVVGQVKPGINFINAYQYMTHCSNKTKELPKTRPNFGKGAGKVSHGLGSMKFFPGVARNVYDYLLDSDILGSATTFKDVNNMRHPVVDTKKYNYGISGQLFSRRNNDGVLSGAAIVHTLIQHDIKGTFQQVHSVKDALVGKLPLTAAAEKERDNQTRKKIEVLDNTEIFQLMTEPQIKVQHKWLIDAALNPTSAFFTLVPAELKTILRLNPLDPEDKKKYIIYCPTKSKGKKTWADALAQVKELFDMTVLHQILQKQYDQEWDNLVKTRNNLEDKGYGMFELMEQSRERVRDKCTGMKFARVPSHVRRQKNQQQIIDEVYERIDKKKVNYAIKSQVKTGQNQIRDSVVVTHEWVARTNSCPKQHHREWKKRDHVVCQKIKTLIHKMHRREVKGLNTRNRQMDTIRRRRLQDRKQLLARRNRDRKKEKKRAEKRASRNQKVYWATEEDPIPLTVTISASNQIRNRSNR